MEHKKNEEDYSLRIEGDHNCLVVNSDHADLSEEIISSEKPGEYNNKMAPNAQIKRTSFISFYINSLNVCFK